MKKEYLITLGLVILAIFLYDKFVKAALAKATA